MSERWKLGDVIIWFQTGTEQNSKTDADVFIKFYDDEDRLVGWVKAYERGDFAGFEEGELNCGFLGNLNKIEWLKHLLREATRLGISIEQVSGDHPDWFLESVSLDFRIGPRPDTVTARNWRIGQWIKPGGEEQKFECEVLAEESAEGFGEVGFEKEVEIQAGSATDSPR